MLRSRQVLLLPSLVLLFLVSALNHAEPPLAQTCEKNQSPIQTLFFYKPVQNITMSWLMKNTDFYILTKNDEKELAEAKAAGEGPVLQYIQYDAIQDPCFQAMNAAGSPCHCDRNPFNNQVAWKPEDICWIRDNHPDWFLRGKSGELLYYHNHVMMDPGNQGWRDFWVSRLEEYHSQYAWDGIFVDNLATRFGLHDGNHVPLQKYTTDAVYQDAVVEFFKDVKSRYFDPKGLPIYANVSVYGGTLPVYLRYLDEFLDGAMDEFWAYPRQGFYEVDNWESHLTRMEETLGRGKKALLVAQGVWDDHERMRFGLASYLLIANENAYFRYTRQGSYPRFWLFDDYNAPLGEPLGAYTTDGVTWRRQFANGEVSVTPADHEATITVYDPSGGCIH